METFNTATVDSRNLCLAFDTETSGLWPKDNKISIERYPYIVQISFVLYDVDQNKILKTYNTYIKQTVELDYNSQAFNITKITKEMCDSGVPIEEALQEFYAYYLIAGSVIAHNIDFDKKMIQLELLRNHHILSKQIEGIHVIFNDVFNDVFNIKTCCSMLMGKDVTNIIMTGRDGRKWKKSPKLSELYEKLFDTIPENLHDSMVDTLLCLKCFIKMKYKKDVDIGL
tara:strand:- start:6864 stop:7544 length:681 start_codon:yes stop_codon:yes gene_type:complete